VRGNQFNLPRCFRVKKKETPDAWAPFAPRKSRAFEIHLGKVGRDLCHKLIVVVGSRCSCVGQSIRSLAVFAGKRWQEGPASPETPPPHRSIRQIRVVYITHCCNAPIAAVVERSQAEYVDQLPKGIIRDPLGHVRVVCMNTCA
jgi:hypothetical protein